MPGLEAKQAAAILRARKGKFVEYKIQENHWDGVALVRLNKDPKNGPPREILLAATDTLEQMHKHIISQYAPPSEAQRHNPRRQSFVRRFLPKILQF